MSTRSSSVSEHWYFSRDQVLDGLREGREGVATCVDVTARAELEQVGRLGDEARAVVIGEFDGGLRRGSGEQAEQEDRVCLHGKSSGAVKWEATVRTTEDAPFREFE